jgi:hypothetical protein
MRRLVVVLFGVVALALPLTSAAAAASSGAPSGFEKVVFVDYAAQAAAQPTATASSTDFHLLGGHPSWAASSVDYSVDASGCTNAGCSGATAAVDAAFNAWEVSGITFTDGTADANPCGGTDSVTWAPIDGPGGTLASTAVCRNTATKEIVGFQTVFDSGDLWSASGGDASHFDIQATATHEEGHTLGLDHVHSPFDARLTMYPFITPGDVGFQTLGCGELLGVNALYGTTLSCTNVPND